MEDSNLKTVLRERVEIVALTGTLGVLLVLFELSPVTERALFLSNGAQSPVKAFAASVEPLDASQARREAGQFNRLVDGMRNRRRAAGNGANPGVQRFAYGGDTPPPISMAGPNSVQSDSGAGQPSGGSASSFGGTPPLSPAAPGPNGIAPGTNTTTSSSSGGLATSSSTSSSSGGITTTSTGGVTTTSTTSSTSSSSGGTTTTSSSSGGGSTTPVPSVPEAGTWLTMLLGFFLIGTLIRHGPKAMQTADGQI